MSKNINTIAPQLKADPYAKSDIINAAGFPAFHRSLHEEYLQMCMVNAIGQTYYANTSQLLEQAQSLHTLMLATDPAYMTRALVYARKKGFMRMQPILGLVHLSTIPGDYLEKAFEEIILTPGDLLDFVQICLYGDVRHSEDQSGRRKGGMGRRLKRLISRYLADRLTEYHIIKYGSEKQAFSLRDVVRLVHPDAQTLFPKDIQARKVFEAKLAYLVGKPCDIDLLPQIAAFEEYKAAETEEYRAVLIEKGRLPHEVITGVGKPTQKLWQMAQAQMPILALLRNLRTLMRHEALDVELFLKAVSADRIQHARVFPFQLFMAYLAVKDSATDPRLVNALSLALDAAADNLPRIPQDAVIFCDISSSMDERINKDSDVRYWQIAALFMASLARQNTGRYLMFNTHAHKLDVLANSPVLGVVSEIARAVGGGTRMSAVPNYLLAEGWQSDCLIGFTDNMTWADKGPQGFLGVWGEYKRRHPKARAFLIQMTADQGMVAPPDETDVYFIYGWSNTVLDYIGLQLQTGGLVLEK